MVETKESTIGQRVADEFNSADDYKAFRIDYCCDGNHSIHELNG